jgi:hypothetical protein
MAPKTPEFRGIWAPYLLLQGSNSLLQSGGRRFESDRGLA